MCVFVMYANRKCICNLCLVRTARILKLKEAINEDADDELRLGFK